jgi:hypothetical protein
MPKLSVALRPVSARLFAVVLATVSLVAAPASAQTPPSATVTQWDIAAATATDGVTPGSTSTMRNVMAVALDETTGRIFFATLRGGTGATSGVKLGELNAAGTKLFEYRFGPGLSTTVAVPSLAWHSNGDVWMGTAATATGGGAIVLRRSEDGAGAVTVTKYTSTDFASTFSTTAATGVALAPDGQSLFFANAAGDHILRVTRTGTGSDKLPIGSTGGAPRHVALQTSGNTINAVWYVRPNGTVGRLRLQSGSWDRTEWTAPALPALPLVSTATGIHVQPTAGTLGSPLVCVTVAGLLDLVSPGLSTGEVRCLDSGADRMIRVTSPGAGYPQPITTNANGALFFTETTRDAVSFVAPSLIAAAASTPGSFDTYTESTATSITAVSITVTLTSLTELTTGTGPTTSTVTQIRRIERPTTPLVVPVSNAAVAANNVEVGYTRFLLPSPGTSVNPRPNSLSVVTGTSSTLPGTIVVGESFQSPLNSDATSNGRITRVEFGALPTTQANFTLCVKKVGDASCIPGNNFDAIAIQNTGTASQYTVTIGSTGSSLAWQARKLGADTDWLELSSPSGNTASAGTLTLTLDHLTPPLSSSPTARSATLVIDDDPSDGGPETGAPALSFIVTLTVDPPPSITLANTDTLVFHNPQQGQTKTFQVENAGGGTVNWTAMSNNPSFLSVTLQGSVGRFGTSTATVTVMTTPGVSENPDSLPASRVLTSRAGRSPACSRWALPARRIR